MGTSSGHAECELPTFLRVLLKLCPTVLCHIQEKAEALLLGGKSVSVFRDEGGTHIVS